MENFSYLVIGAGLQGCGIALELSRRGLPVTLIEQDQFAMNRASLRNEGKIHLGLIYAADRSRKTALLQLQGALQFSKILKSWLGDRIKNIHLSDPFYYLVAKDSLLRPDELYEHYAYLEAIYTQRILLDDELDYLGLRDTFFISRAPLKHFKKILDITRFDAVFATSERAVDTEHLAYEIRRAIKQAPNINFISEAKVIDVCHKTEGIQVVLKKEGNSKNIKIQAKKVFNASWDSRLWLDRMVGLEPRPGWVHRLKYRVIVRLPESANPLISATIVLGAYGDVVIREKTAYLSWYPCGLKGWSHDLLPPKNWENATRVFSTDADSQRIGQEILSNTLDWYPGLLGSKIITVDAGAIFAYGKTDVTDQSSDLHDRSNIGIFRCGNWLSVDPGKLTTAPMFAIEAVNAALLDS